MDRLIVLERSRTSLRPYRIGAGICGLVLLGMVYLLAAVPHFDPVETGEELFTTYFGLSVMNGTLAMAFFSILLAVLGAKLIVEEFTGKKAYLLLSYPVSRGKILGAKLILAVGYAAGAMAVLGSGAMLLFFLTEQFIPLCPDQLNPDTVLKSVGILFLCILMAVELGIFAVWIGYVKRSAAAAVVASVILASLGCQLIQLSYLSAAAAGAGVLVMLAPAALAVHDLFKKIQNLEV